jgi:hypothetical protein
MKGKPMSPALKHTLPLTVLSLTLTLPAIAAEPAPSLEPLQGKWQTTKTNNEGQRYSQVLSIQKDKLTFEIQDEDGQARFVAKATIKTERLGPFEVFTSSGIQAGRSVDALEAVDDSRASIYTLRDGKLIIASNFDKERENQRPGIDVYNRVEAPKQAAAGKSGGEDRLVGNWNVEVSLGDDTRDYEFRFAKSEGQLQATLVSPRSGDHKAKSVTFKEDDLLLEVDRDIQGNEVTFVYKGKLSSDGLSGKVSVKGYEDQFTGTWKASKKTSQGEAGK